MRFADRRGLLAAGTTKSKCRVEGNKRILAAEEGDELIKRSKRTRAKNRMIAALDADARRRVVEERDQNLCQRCGRRDGEWDTELGRPVRIQWAHVHTREYHVTRWEEENSLALDDRCHVWFDNHKVLSYEWFRKNWPERWERIHKILQSRTKAGDLFIKERHAELKGSANA